MRASSILLLAACVGGPPAALAGTSGEDVPSPVRTFRTEARVTVDASGRVTDVQPDAALPAGIAGAVQKQVAGWRFAAPVRDGAASAGVTFVQLGACIAPVGDGTYRLAVDYAGNGPRRSGPLAPAYPLQLIKRGLGGSLQLTFRVEPDGRTVVEDMRTLSMDPGAAPLMKAAVRDWVAQLRFEPEEVAGRPVATRMRYPVDFVPAGRPISPIQARDEAAAARARELTHEASRPACRAAAQQADGPRMVALDSPFLRLAAD